MSVQSTKVVVVTGSSKGLGKAITKLVNKLGFKVFGISRSEPQLKELETKLGADKFYFLAGDLTKDEVIENIKLRVKELNLEVIALINNAGAIEPIKKVTEVKAEELRQIFDVNVISVMALTQALLPNLIKNRGCVINISSGASTKPYIGWGAYCSTKAALNMYTQSLAAEVDSITSISIRPGVIDTPMQELIREKGSESMRKEDHTKFVELKSNTKLLNPNQPGTVIARLAVNGIPSALNGQYISWDADELAQFNQLI